MNTNSRSPSKRARTVLSDPKAQQDTNEDLSQVVNLVERRRLQNRISQRNYRNKIRVRLEKLEALVDATANTQPQTPGAGESQTSGGTGPQPSSRNNSPREPLDDVRPGLEDDYLDMSTDPLDSWRSTPGFLRLSETDLERTCQCSHSEAVSMASSSHQMQESYPALAQPDQIGSEALSTGLPSPDLGSPHSRILLSSASPADLNTGSDSYFFVQRPPPSTPEPSMIDSGTSYHSQNVYPPNSQLAYAYPFPYGMPLMPLSPVAHPNAGAETGMGSPTDNAHGYGVPSFRPPQALYLQPQQYVWVPVPVMSLPADVAKQHGSPAGTPNSRE